MIQTPTRNASALRGSAVPKELRESQEADNETQGKAGSDGKVGKGRRSFGGRRHNQLEKDG